MKVTRRIPKVSQYPGLVELEVHQRKFVIFGTDSEEEAKAIFERDKSPKFKIKV